MESLVSVLMHKNTQHTKRSQTITRKHPCPRSTPAHNVSQRLHHPSVKGDSSFNSSSSIGDVRLTSHRDEGRAEASCRKGAISVGLRDLSHKMATGSI
jgi:hypothetical protein